jgi:hypothetical protein
MLLCMSVLIFIFTSTCVRHTLVARVRSGSEKYRQDHKCSDVRLLSLMFCDVSTYLVTMSYSRPIGVILLTHFYFFIQLLLCSLFHCILSVMTLSQETINPHKSIVSGCPVSFLHADASVSATMYLYMHVCKCIIQLNYFFCLLVCICSN